MKKMGTIEVKTDKQAPPSQFGANQLECTPIGAPLTEATAFTLIQQLQQNSSGTN
jgi:hypothetical protein